jgi:SAM-dependent methyltransferase
MTADLSPSAYDAFAPFYDAFTSASDYETWTEQVLAAGRRHGMHGKALLDLACGTGKSFEPLMRRGFRVTACDASPGMLAEASIRAPEATLLRADIRALPDLGAFDLVTCFDDSLNYLADEDELGAAFAGMAQNMRAGGLALFDLNTLRAYRTTFATDSVSEHDGVVFAWRGLGSPDGGPGCVAEAQIDVFFTRADGAYERILTRHVQRHFERAGVVELLADAGLDCVAVHGVRGDVSLDDVADEDHHLKVLYMARRAEGGDS